MRGIVYSLTLIMIVGCQSLISEHLSVKATLEKAYATYHIGQFQKSREYIKSGLAKSSTIEHRSKNPYFHTLLAQIQHAEGDYHSAIVESNNCIESAQEQQNINQVLFCQLLLSANYIRLGQLTAAQGLIKKIRKQSHTLINPALNIEYHLTHGLLNQTRGEMDDALSDYQKAYDQAVIEQDGFLAARSLNNIGGVYRKIAAYDEAKLHYDEALRLRKQLNDRAGLASTFGNICNLYIQISDYTTAEVNCQKAFRYARAASLINRKANILNSLATIYRQQSNFNKALRSYEKSMHLKLQIADASGAARTINNIGEIKLIQGQIGHAQENFNLALRTLDSAENVIDQGPVYGNLGLVYEANGKIESAIDAYQQALVIYLQSNNVENQWRTLSNLSQLYQEQNKTVIAIFFGKQAVNVIQKIRTNLKQFNPQHQLAFIQAKRHVYENLADQLISDGRLYEAQDILLMYKQEEFLDYSSRSENLDMDLIEVSFSKVEQRFVDGYTKLSQNLVDVYLQYEVLKKKKDNPETQDIFTEDEEDQLDALDLILFNASEKLTTFTNNLIIQLATNEANAFKIATKGLTNINKTIGQINRLDDIEPTAMINYLITDNRLRIIVSFSDSNRLVITRDTPITRQQLNQLIGAFRDDLLDPNSKPKATAKALYDVMFKPIRAELDDKSIRMLVIHLDEALRYIPIAALHDGENYLIQYFKMSLYTSQTDLSAPKNDGPWRIAGLGVSKKTRDFSALPAVELELNTIIKEGDDDPGGVLSGRVYLNEAFTQDSLQSVLRDDHSYQVVHIASHYNYAPLNSQDSFLLTGRGPLSLDVIANGDFPVDKIELFTLSACETGLDISQSTGIEIDGLANTLLQKSVRSVMATLWQVSDASTALLMFEFYRVRESLELTKAVALQTVQKQFSNRQITISNNNLDTKEINVAEFGGNQPADYSHPFYWAPFVLIGNFL